jgi:hypothetical protein
VSLRTESVSAKHVRLYGTRWTPAYFIWDPLVSKLVPDETHAVLSSAVAAALGHEF